MKTPIIVVIFILILAGSCGRRKAQEKNPVQSEKVATLSMDTFEHADILLTPSIPLSGFDYLQVEIANQSTESFPLNEFCIQIKDEDNWKTLFCDTVQTTVILPNQTKTLPIDLHLDEFQYSSKELYRFVAYYQKDNSVYQISKTYYSLTLFKKNGKVYMLPDTIIENESRDRDEEPS